MFKKELCKEAKKILAYMAKPGKNKEKKTACLLKYLQDNKLAKGNKKTCPVCNTKYPRYTKVRDERGDVVEKYNLVCPVCKRYVGEREEYPDKYLFLVKKGDYDHPDKQEIEQVAYQLCDCINHYKPCIDVSYIGSVDWDD